MKWRLLPVIGVVVVVLDATLLATGAIGPGTALALFLAVEVPLGAAVVGDYLRRYRSLRARSGRRRDAWRALAGDDPYLRMIVAEARTVASLGRWIARRPDVPRGAVAIGYSRGTLGMPLMMVAAALIELVAIHLLVPWPTVRLVLDLLGVYALIVVLGWLAGRIVRPHLVVGGELAAGGGLAAGGELVLRSGPAVCARVPLDAVSSVRRDRRLSLLMPGLWGLGPGSRRGLGLGIRLGLAMVGPPRWCCPGRTGRP
ncbi:hypothetical protein ACFSSF_04620 [Dietzia aerolata]|uniref:hypothetical protein n=1 Tax=Dietzia aerolata TaxID=595984 RepID=UPI003632FDB8